MTTEKPNLVVGDGTSIHSTSTTILNSSSEYVATVGTNGLLIISTDTLLVVIPKALVDPILANLDLLPEDRRSQISDALSKWDGK